MPRKRSRSKSPTAKTGRSSSPGTQKTREAKISWAYTLQSLRYAFLAKREIQMDVIEILQGVMLLVGYCTLILAFMFGIAAFVVQFFAWLEVLNVVLLFGLRILQPKVIASAPAVTKLYAKSEASQIRKTVSFPKLYIAHTGYYVDNDPNKPILGVYAAEHIKSG